MSQKKKFDDDTIGKIARAYRAGASPSDIGRQFGCSCQYVINISRAYETKLKLKAFQYDIVCNGFEIASGSVRNHRPDTMVKAFEITGLGQKEVEERFGGLYRAFQYGAPPHGGSAPGFVL